jgi:hypothetical protein
MNWFLNLSKIVITNFDHLSRASPSEIETRFTRNENGIASWKHQKIVQNPYESLSIVSMYNIECKIDVSVNDAPKIQPVTEWFYRMMQNLM